MRTRLAHGEYTLWGDGGHDYHVFKFDGEYVWALRAGGGVRKSRVELRFLLNGEWTTVRKVGTVAEVQLGAGHWIEEEVLE